MSERFVDSLGLASEVRAGRADDDSSVLEGPRVVKFQEVSPVLCNQDPPLESSEGEHFFVRDPSIRLTGIE